MKYLKIACLSLVFAAFSCSTTTQLPVSNVVPAANITAKISKGDHENTDIKITARHLANPKRLSPSKNLYVVWIVTDNDMVKNVGTIVQDGDDKVSLEIITPFKVKEILITAEDKGNITKPGKMLISSKKL